MSTSTITAAMLNRRTDVLRALCAKAAGDLKMVKFSSVLASEKASKAPRVLSFKQRLLLAINAPGRVVVESLAIREARELQALTVRAAVYAANHPRGRAVFLPTLRSFGAL
jgi:hypothetical protein